MDKIKTPTHNVPFPVFAAFFCAIITLVTIFLPFTEAKNGAKSYSYIDRSDNATAELPNDIDPELYDYNIIDENSIASQDDTNVETIDTTKMSLFRYAKLYSKNADVIFGDSSFGYFYVGIIVLTAILAVLTAYFAYRQMPFICVVTSFLLLAVFVLLTLDFKSRGVVNGESYGWGFGYYLYLIASIITFASSIIFIKDKIMAARKKETEETEKTAES